MRRFKSEYLNQFIPINNKWNRTLLKQAVGPALLCGANNLLIVYSNLPI